MRTEGLINLVGADFGTEVCVGCDRDRKGIREYMRKLTGSPYAEFFTGHKLDKNTFKLRFMMCGSCFRRWKKWADEEINGACPHRWILKERKEREKARAAGKG